MQELGTLCFTCAPLTFNVLPVKEHPLRNYLLSETSKASILKLFGMRKKKTLNSFTLGLHTVHIELPILLPTRFASCSYLPGKHCLISPSIATRSHVEPEQLLAKDMNISADARYFQWDETTEIVWPCHSLTHSLNPVFEVLLWMSKMPIQNLFMLFLLLMLILKEA